VVAAVAALGLALIAAPAAADTSDTASAAAQTLRTLPIFVSPQAQSLGFAQPTETSQSTPAQPRIAIVSRDEASAGQLAAQIKAQLGDGAHTVGVVLVGPNGVTDFHAVSDSTSFCKGGADYAAHQVLDKTIGTRAEPDALLQRYESALAQLPPDRVESSCASALAHHHGSDAKAWLWMLIAAAAGLLGIGAFAVFVRRTVRARGEQPVRENLPQWITEEDAPDEQSEADDGEIHDGETHDGETHDGETDDAEARDAQDESSAPTSQEPLADGGDEQR
jgi:hypothetical protein